jgi:16S rRNA C1402 (ribose-2'-O) methylase RsmI
LKEIETLKNASGFPRNKFFFKGFFFEASKIRTRRIKTLEENASLLIIMAWYNKYGLKL